MKDSAIVTVGCKRIDYELGHSPCPITHWLQRRWLSASESGLFANSLLHVRVADLTCIRSGRKQ